MRVKGKIISWNEDKAFGFIKLNGSGKQVFIHKNGFTNKARTPKQQDEISFLISKDKQGRACAIQARFSTDKMPKKAKSINQFSIYLAVLFLLSLIFADLAGQLPQYFLYGYLGLSWLTMMIYAVDKIKAKNNSWRVSEQTLHILAVLGGWPGAALAQQIFRHKSQKRQFRQVYWLTVGVNLSALIWLSNQLV